MGDHQKTPPTVIIISLFALIVFGRHNASRPQSHSAQHTSLQHAYIRFTIGNISMTESLLSRKTGVAAVMRIIKTCKPDGNYELENKWFNLLFVGISNIKFDKRKKQTF